MLVQINTKSDLVLFGSAQMADLMTVYLQHFSDYNIVGYTVDRAYCSDGETSNGRPLVPSDELEIHFKPGEVKLMGPVNYKGPNKLRRDRYYDGRARGYAYGSFIHPGASVMTDKIGDHVIIMEQTVIEPFVELGDNVIVWSNSHVGHHTKVGNHTFMSSYVGISGGVTIGEECYLAGQVGIANGVSIGDRCALMNSAGIMDNLPDDTLALGQKAEIKPYPSSKIARLL